MGVVKRFVLVGWCLFAVGYRIVHCVDTKLFLVLVCLGLSVFGWVVLGGFRWLA